MSLYSPVSVSNIDISNGIRTNFAVNYDLDISLHRVFGLDLGTTPIACSALTEGLV